MGRWTITFVLIVLVATIMAPAAMADHSDKCIIEYKDGQFTDFSELLRIQHRDDSVTVNYIMERTVLNVRYESDSRARYWLGEVRDQLRYC